MLTASPASRAAAISRRVVASEVASGPCNASAKLVRAVGGRSTASGTGASSVPPAPWRSSSSSFRVIDVPYAKTERIGSSRCARIASSPCSGVLTMWHQSKSVVMPCSSASTIAALVATCTSSGV